MNFPEFLLATVLTLAAICTGIAIVVYMCIDLVELHLHRKAWAKIEKEQEEWERRRKWQPPIHYLRV